MYKRQVLGHVVMETSYRASSMSVSGSPGVVVQGTTSTKPLAAAGGPEYRDSDILASFQENTPGDEIARLVENQGYHVKRVIEGTGIHVIGIPEGRDPVRAADDLSLIHI